MQPIARAKPKERLWENFFFVPLTAIATAVVAIWAFDFDRIPPFSLTDGEVVPTAVRGGEHITVRWHLTVVRTASFSQTCTRAIVDSLGGIRPVEEREAHGVRTVAVPFDAAWGKASYRQSCCYEFNGVSLTRLFPICVRRPHIQFEVLPPAKT